MAVSPRRLTAVIPSLTAGGAERVLVDLVTHWARAGWTVTVVTTEGPDSDHFALPAGVSRVALGYPRPSGKLAIASYVARVTVRLRSVIRRSRPDVVLSFMEITNVLVLLASRGARWPVVVAERTDPRQHRISWIWERCRRLLYPAAAAVAVQTNAVRAWALGFLPPHLVHVIPNAARPPAGVPTVRTRTDEARREIIAVGRLGREKGMDLLLSAAALVLPSHPDWSLVIAGDGPERTALERQAGALGIAHRVRFAGRVGDIDSMLRAADLYVLPSRYEGFPNALMEAMACALPVISADCPSGPAEMIRDGVDGRLVPPEDANALARVLEELITDPDQRRRLAGRAVDVLDRFSQQRVHGLWDDVLGTVIAGAAVA